jgi:uncharacterized protein
MKAPEYVWNTIEKGLKMRVALIRHDKPDHLHLRLENRTAHIAYLNETGVVDLAGPLISDTGEMNGSLIVLNVDSMEDARDWAENDPYNKAGLFASLLLSEWKRVIG